MNDAEVSRAELGSQQQHKNTKMNDDMHQIPQLRMDPTFSESSSDGSNATPSSNSNNKRKARSKSKKDKANDKHEEAAQQRRCRIITILSSIPFVLSLVALLIVLTKDKEDTQTTISSASAVLDEADHQIWPVSNTQLQMQPNDSPQSNDDKADDYLAYNEVLDSTTTLNMSQEKCHEVEIVSMFTTWNLLRKDSYGFQSVESSFEMASNSDAIDDETLCLEEGEYLLIAMVSGDEGYYRITSNGMLIGEGQVERTTFSIPFVPRVQGKSAKAPFVDTRRPLILATPSPSDDSMEELVGESVKTAAVENDAPTYSPTSWYPTYGPTSDMPTYSPSTTSTHDPISDMPSYSPTASKYVLSAAKTRDTISDMPTYEPSDTVRHPTYEPTSKSTDTLHSPTYYPTEQNPTTDV